MQHSQNKGALMALKSGLISLCLFMAGNAMASSLTSFMDQFVVTRNGSLFVSDTFSDGLPLPSTEAFYLGNPLSPAGFSTQGAFLEAGGKLIMDSRYGLPNIGSLVNADTGTTIFHNELTRIHEAFLTTNASQDPLNAAGLKRDHHTFEVLGLFDLVQPQISAGNYGIGLVDQGSSSDRLRLSVIKSPATNGKWSIAYWRNDNTIPSAQVNHFFGHDALDANYDQILLRLSRPSTSSNEIVASYAYVDGANAGMDISNPANLASLSFQTIVNTSPWDATIFNDFVHTRANIRQRTPDEDGRFDFVRMTTGSPVSLSQMVDVGATPQMLAFNYRFETDTGELSVSLGGTVLGTLSAPSLVGNSFASAVYLVGDSFLNQSLELSFIMDGPTGSSILLDSISFQGLQNGTFSTGDMSGWTLAVSPNGNIGVLTVMAVPEPEAYALMLAGLGLVGFAARRRRGGRLACSDQS